MNYPYYWNMRLAEWGLFQRSQYPDAKFEGVTITPTRSLLLNAWARSALPASLPMRLR